MIENHADVPGLFNLMEDAPADNADLYGKDPDQLRAELMAARAELEDTEKRRMQRERAKFKRVSFMADKKQWDLVQRYCYTKGITQSAFVGKAIDAHLEALDVKSKRLKRIPPEGIHKGGRPRK